MSFKNLVVSGLKTLNEDIAFGLVNEKPVLTHITTFFKEDIKQATDKYSKWDYYSDNTKYELKSRRNKYADYPTTIVGVNKTIDVKGRLVFLFHFFDGLYYIIFDPEKFSDYEIKDIKYVRSGGRMTATPHYLIPIGDLQQIII